jgi:hypothetical protein
MSTLACGAIWVVLGRTAWWIPAFALSFVGGYINVGFKIYPHEIGLALSLVAVASVVVTNPHRLAGRPPLDWSLYALIGYMVIHMAVSCYLTTAAGMPGVGTIVRQYGIGLWALVFAALFWAYGDLRYLRIALAVTTVFCVIRAALGVLALYAPEAATPETNGFFAQQPAAVLTGTDLRTAAPLLMALLTVWFYQRTRMFTRVVIGVAYVVAIWLALLGGSRVAALGVFITPLIWALAQRQRVALLAETLVVASLLAAINYSAGFYHSLPDGARRSLSAFVVNHDVRALEDLNVTSSSGMPSRGGTTPTSHSASRPDTTSSSDSWHVTLLRSGFRRWTADLVSLAFGNKVEGWHEDYAKLFTIEDMADVATRLSTYENAFFTVTATLGLVGLLLFMRALYWLYRPFAREILRRGIRSPGDAWALVAVQSLVVYVGLCWIAGGYPSAQIVLGSLATASWCERGWASQSTCLAST